MLLTELTQTFSLFGLGMGTVFVLLSLLISCVSLLSYICQKFFSQSLLSESTAATNVAGNSPTAISSLEVSIVKAAVKAHREANI